MKTYLIGDIAKKMNVTTDTLRYHDKEGLLPFAKGNEAGRRIFTEDDLGYVEVINCLKKSAVPVKEIGQFIEWCMQGDQTLEQRYDFMVKREAALERQIKELETQLAFLRWKSGITPGLKPLKRNQLILNQVLRDQIQPYMIIIKNSILLQINLSSKSAI